MSKLNRQFRRHTHCYPCMFERQVVQYGYNHQSGLQDNGQFPCMNRQRYLTNWLRGRIRLNDGMCRVDVGGLKSVTILGC